MNILTTIQTHLAACNHADMHRLSQDSGVPFHTIYKIKRGETKDPSVTTAQSLFDAIGSSYLNNRTVSKKRNGSQ